MLVNVGEGDERPADTAAAVGPVIGIEAGFSIARTAPNNDVATNTSSKQASASFLHRAQFA
jgi:hypothetical protein